MGLADRMAAKTVDINPPKDGEKFVDELEEKLKEALEVDDAGEDEAEAAAEKVVDAKLDEAPKEKKTTKKKATRKTKANGKPNGKMLIVLDGALPNKAAPLLGETQQLIDILAPLMREVANENDVGHWNLIDFAQGKSILASKLDKLWAKERPTGTIIADNSIEAQAVKSVLAAYADVVIHGVR